MFGLESRLQVQSTANDSHTVEVQRTSLTVSILRSHGRSKHLMSKRHCYCTGLRLSAAMSESIQRAAAFGHKIASSPLDLILRIILVSTRQQPSGQKTSGSSRKSLFYRHIITVKLFVLQESCLDPGGSQAWERSFEVTRAPQHYQHLNPHRPSTLHHLHQ